MTLHIIKLAVGVEDLHHLTDLQKIYRVKYEGDWAIPVRTRFKPAKSDDVLNGGSLYRVIKGRIQCRQIILGFEEADSADRGKQCLIMVSPVLIQTISVPKKPFQGWRYLQPKDAPADKGMYDPAQEEKIDPALAAELKASGLI